jgi:hypothetical protein
MTNHPHRAKPDEPAEPAGELGPPPAYACLTCVGEHKMAAAAGTELPPIQFAVTLAPIPTPMGVCAVPLCYEHIGVGEAPRQSPLLTANGQLPPGLRRPGG